jgi:hypothetical protein
VREREFEPVRAVVEEASEVEGKESSTEECWR